MRTSVKRLLDYVLAPLASQMIVFLVLFALGASPFLMSQQMSDASPAHEMAMLDVPSGTHNAPPITDDMQCLHMVSCIAIIEPLPRLRAVGALVARVAPVTMPLATSRTLAPPFHPPI